MPPSLSEVYKERRAQLRLNLPTVAKAKAALADSVKRESALRLALEQQEDESKLLRLLIQDLGKEKPLVQPERRVEGEIRTPQPAKAKPATTPGERAKRQLDRSNAEKEAKLQAKLEAARAAKAAKAAAVRDAAPFLQVFEAYQHLGLPLATFRSVEEKVKSGEYTVAELQTLLAWCLTHQAELASLDQMKSWRIAKAKVVR